MSFYVVLGTEPSSLKSCVICRVGRCLGFCWAETLKVEVHHAAFVQRPIILVKAGQQNFSEESVLCVLSVIQVLLYNTSVLVILAKKKEGPEIDVYHFQLTFSRLRAPF